MMSGDNEEPVPKRQRREDGVAVEVRDPMQAMREKLGRVSDPHLQARLLLDFSALALAPHAKTEDAVDFLFAFLQQNQSMPSGDQEKRATNAESSSSAAGNSNAVVVAAIVRGLRDLLAIKPKVVEPMIQVDAMGEQLTQCVSVADDFKLRANMLHIVVDCLLSAEKLTDAETLLNACVQDHDDGVRWICLEGYSRLLKKHYQFGEEVVSVLIDRLVDMTANDTSERTRSLAARLLGALMATLGESPLYEDLKTLFVNSVAAMVRDSSAKVRRSVAISLRQLGDTSEQMWTPLLQKQQIVEDLGEVETLSVTMLNSGAVLNLLEDENAEVAREASTSIRKIVEAASWGEELVAKAVESHIDLVIRFSKEPGLLDVLKNLGAVVTKWHAVSSSCYPLHLEKLSHILEVLPTTSAVGSELVGLCRHVAVNHDVAAAKIVKFLIRCSQFEMSDQTSDRKPLPDSTHASMTHIVEDWCKHGVRLEASTISSLRLIASSHTPRTLTECCAVLCNAFCAPEDREVGATRASSQKRMPSFLRGRIGPAPAHTMNEASRPSRVISSDLIGQIMVAVQRLQAQLREDVKTPKGCDARAPMCSNLFHLCCALYARTSFPERSHAERVLLKLVWLAVLGCSTDPTALQKEASQLPDAKSDPMLSPFLSSRPYREDDLDATLLQSLAGFRAQDLLDGVAEGHFNRLAIGSILEPSKVGPNEAIEVSSQLPFTLLVRCVMHYPPTNGDVFIKIQLPDGEDHFCPLNTVNASADRVEAETTISVQLPSFSDPTYVSLSVCIRAPKSLPQVEASRYYDISPVTKILVCHRTVPLRQSTNRGH